MNILLSGGTGFLGSHLLRKLVNQNHEVVVLKRSFSNLYRVEDMLGKMNVIVYDTDKTELDSIFNRHGIDVIVHVATEYGKDKTSISKVLEANLILPLRLLELAIKNNVKSFINTDSYFNKENRFYSNLLDYSLSKRSLLAWLKQLSSRIRVANIVLEHIYGPYDSEMKFVESLIQRIAIRNVERIGLTHGHQRRDFVYVDDVVDAYVIVLNYIYSRGIGYRAFEVGTGNSVEVREFVSLIKDLSNSKTILGFGDIPYRGDEIMDSKADIRSLRELGWLPKVSIKDGLSSILEIYNRV